MTLIPIHPRPMSLMSYNPTIILPGTEQERRYFQRFCDRTAPAICGSFDPKFWTEKVLQLCYNDAPIRHGIIALAALARSLEITSSPTRLSLSGFPNIDHHDMDDHHRFALNQYSKAIAALRGILSDGRRHLRTSLTSCVLFMTFEAFQGTYEGAVTHLRGGSRLLGDWRTARQGGKARLSQDSLSEIQDDMIDDLGRMFARLDVQGLFIPPPCLGSFLVGRTDPLPVPDLHGEQLEVPSSFPSTHDAKEFWDFLMAGIGQFHRKSLFYENNNPKELTSASWLRQHEKYSAQMVQWRTAFQEIHHREVNAGKSRADESVTISLYYNVATILLATSLQHTEMVYDEHTRLFQEVVSESQYLLSRSEDPTNTSRFTLDLGTILPLAITAIKCRDRRIRRQAIALLWSKARREGLCFDTIAVARICAWLSSIEAQGVQEDSETIPEEARVNISNVKFNPDERWFWIQLSYMKDESGNRKTRETTFSW